MTSGSIYTVVPGRIVETVEARGRVEGKQEALLVFPLSGALKHLYISSGDSVEAGTLLAELDAPQAREEVLRTRFDLEVARAELRMAEYALAQSRSVITYPTAVTIHTGDEGPYFLRVPLRTGEPPAVAQARITVEQAEEELKKAAVEWDRAIHRAWLSPDSLEPYTWTLQLREWNYQVAQIQLAQALRNWQMEQARREAEVELARIRFDQANALHMLASAQLSSTLLTAPFSGVIISLEKQPGDWIGAYEPIGAVADPTELRVVVTILEEDLYRIAVGRPVTILLDAYPDWEYTGSILQISREPILWQGQRAYEATVMFDPGQDIPAIIRMGVDVLIAGRTKENVLLVPTRAILTVGGRQYVEVVTENRGVMQVEVETGISGGKEVEIIAGLQAGQKIRIP